MPTPGSRLSLQWKPFERCNACGISFYRALARAGSSPLRSGVNEELFASIEWPTLYANARGTRFCEEGGALAAIRCEAQMVRLRVRCAGWHRIQAWKKLIRPTSQNGETNRLTKTSLGRSRSTNSLQSADFIAAEVRFPIFRHCLQVLSSTVSMVKASPGRASCLAPCSASSRVLNRSQSSFESDHRM